MRKELIIILIVIATALFTACHHEPPLITAPEQGPNIKENLANANRYIVESEETQINAYVTRHGWETTRLQNGSRIYEYERGGGPAIEYEETIVIDYNLGTLTGSTIYTGECDTIVVGRQKPTRGLDAALMKLRHGSKAIVIVPSNEGYGVVGDGYRVTSRMVLVYDMHIK